MATTAKPKRNTNAVQVDPLASFVAGGGAPAGAAALPASEQETEEADTEHKKPVMIRFDRALLERVDAAAKKRGVSRSAWVQFMLSSILDAEQERQAVEANKKEPAKP